MKKIFNNNISSIRHPELGSGSLTSSCGNAAKRSRTKFGMTAGAFTLAEVLITLAIIGVVAALTIPSVISNSQQQEFKTGLRKAVSVLNSAITMNMAIDGESPYDNANLFGYLQRHMSVIKSSKGVGYYTFTRRANGISFNGTDNAVFYTTDGFRYEFDAALTSDNSNQALKLHESDVKACGALSPYLHSKDTRYQCFGCGSYGLTHNPNNTTKRPCSIVVDVNGDKKPTPRNANCKTNSKCATDNLYRVPLPAEKKVRDIFSILITEDRAIPYGVTAQKAMYDAQK